MVVYVASKNMRGKWAAPPHADVHKVDVTSAQAKNTYRLGFSPMHVEEGRGFLGPDGDKYACFEHFWQSRKVYSDVDYASALAWWRKQKTPKRRYPGSKTKRVLYARDPRFPGEQIGYVDSRKLIYVPDYIAKTSSASGILAMRKAQAHMAERDVVVYDFDGPRADDGAPECRELTLDLLREKINDTRFPFGHGYVVAALLAGVPPSEYVDK